MCRSSTHVHVIQAVVMGYELEQSDIMHPHSAKSLKQERASSLDSKLQAISLETVDEKKEA